MTTVMAAAVGCSSSGAVGAGGQLDLKTVTAAQAVKAREQAAAAKQTVHIHSTATAKRFSQTIDGVQRTDRYEQDVTVETRVTGAQESVHGEIRGVGGAAYLDDSGFPAEYRQDKKWIKFDLSHPPSADTGSPGAALLANLGDLYAHEDPRQKALFPLAFPDLRRVGVETRDGRQVLHLAGSAAPGALAATPPDGSGLTQDYLDFRRRQAKTDSLTKIGVDVWIGADGLPVAFTETDTGPDGDMVVAETMSQWGASLSVTVPPSADTYSPPST
jgi:hypothetical protein